MAAPSKRKRDASSNVQEKKEGKKEVKVDLAQRRDVIRKILRSTMDELQDYPATKAGHYPRVGQAKTLRAGLQSLLKPIDFEQADQLASLFGLPGGAAWVKSKLDEHLLAQHPHFQIYTSAHDYMMRHPNSAVTEILKIIKYQLSFPDTKPFFEWLENQLSTENPEKIHRYELLAVVAQLEAIRTCYDHDCWKDTFPAYVHKLTLRTGLMEELTWVKTRQTLNERLHQMDGVIICQMMELDHASHLHLQMPVLLKLKEGSPTRYLHDLTRHIIQILLQLAHLPPDHVPNFHLQRVPLIQIQQQRVLMPGSVLNPSEQKALVDRYYQLADLLTDRRQYGEMKGILEIGSFLRDTLEEERARVCRALQLPNNQELGGFFPRDISLSALPMDFVPGAPSEYDHILWSRHIQLQKLLLTQFPASGRDTNSMYYRTRVNDEQLDKYTPSLIDLHIPISRWSSICIKFEAVFSSHPPATLTMHLDQPKSPSSDISVPSYLLDPFLPVVPHNFAQYVATIVDHAPPLIPPLAMIILEYIGFQPLGGPIHHYLHAYLTLPKP